MNMISFCFTGVSRAFCQGRWNRGRHLRKVCVLDFSESDGLVHGTLAVFDCSFLWISLQQTFPQSLPNLLAQRISRNFIPALFLIAPPYESTGLSIIQSSLVCDLYHNRGLLEFGLSRRVSIKVFGNRVSKILVPSVVEVLNPTSTDNVEGRWFVAMGKERLVALIHVVKHLIAMCARVQVKWFNTTL